MDKKLVTFEHPKYGLLTLHCYASGSGALSFCWSDKDRISPGVKVSERDALEYLETKEGQRFKDNYFLYCSEHQTLLVHKVTRRGKQRLEIDGKIYHYADLKGLATEHTAYNTKFYTSKKFTEKDEIKNISIVSALIFFLNHESWFKDE
ncbi:MAG: hypothetical protein V3V74_07310 [Nitrosomonadaceae bacterium]